MVNGQMPPLVTIAYYRPYPKLRTEFQSSGFCMRLCSNNGCARPPKQYLWRRAAFKGVSLMPRRDNLLSPTDTRLTKAS
jgi:hypothetical protein